MIEDVQDTAIMAAFGNEFVPRLKELHVDVLSASHDERRSVLTVALMLPAEAGPELREEVSRVLSDFEEDCHLGVMVDPSYLFEGETEPATA